MAETIFNALVAIYMFAVLLISYATYHKLRFVVRSNDDDYQRPQSKRIRTAYDDGDDRRNYYHYDHVETDDEREEGVTRRKPSEATTTTTTTAVAAKPNIDNRQQQQQRPASEDKDKKQEASLSKDDDATLSTTRVSTKPHNGQEVGPQNERKDAPQSGQATTTTADIATNSVPEEGTDSTNGQTAESSLSSPPPPPKTTNESGPQSGETVTPNANNDDAKGDGANETKTDATEAKTANTGDGSETKTDATEAKTANTGAKGDQNETKTDTVEAKMGRNPSITCFERPPKSRKRALGTNLDLEAARSVIPEAEFPQNITKYDFYGPTTGLYKTWNEDVLALGDMCLMIKQGLFYAHHNPNTQGARFAIAVAENFMLRYDENLKITNKIPWGNNWYQFSITSTCMLAYYILLQDTSLKMFAAKLILRLISNPRFSLEYGRDEANAVYMAGPWLLANYVLGDLESAWKHESYRYVLRYINLDFQYKRSENGLHRDYSYLAHSTLFAPAYLRVMDSDITAYFYKMDPNITNSPSSIWRIARSYLEHPSIPLTLLGMYGRKSTLTSGTYPKSPFGVRVMPYARLLRFFTPRHIFMARGQVSWLGFYEADNSVDYTAQYWVQYRGVLTAETSPKLVFPNSGFINLESNNGLVTIPSTTSTTTVFYPLNARSVVLAYGVHGVLYQEYEIEQFGKFRVKELIVINAELQTIVIHTEIINDELLEVVNFYGTDRKARTIEPRRRTVFVMTFDLKTDESHTAISPWFPPFPLTLNDYVQVELVDDAFCMLLLHGQPKICAPFALENELEYLPVVLRGETHVFKFDRELNQYSI